MAAIGLDPDEAAGRAALAAEQAPGGVVEALARAGEHAGMVERADHAPQPQAAPVLARATGILDQAVGLDEQRVVHLDRLHRQVRGVGDVNLHAILAVARGAPAEAAAQRLEVDVALLRGRVDPGEDRGRVRAIGRGDGPALQGRRQRTDQRVDDALRGMGPVGHRGRVVGLDQAAGRGAPGTDVQHTLVVRHLRVEQRLQRVADRGQRRGGGAIDVARHLSGGALEGHMQVVAGHAHLHADRDVAGAAAVVVHHVAEAVDAVRQAGDCRAHAQRRAAHDLVERGQHLRAAVPGDDLLEAARAEPHRGDLREQVAAALLRDPGVEQDQVIDAGLQPSGLVELDQRNAQAFLVDLGHAAGHAAGAHAAEVGMVGDVADEGDRGAGVEDRHRHVQVRQVGAAGDEGVVGNKDVAFLQGGDVHLRQQRLHHAHDRAQVDRQRFLGLHDQPALHVHQRGGVVAALLDVLRIGALHQCDEGLVHDGGEGVLDDLQRDQVDGGGRVHGVLLVMSRLR
jgi:hypothetical protein